MNEDDLRDALHAIAGPSTGGPDSRAAVMSTAARRVRRRRLAASGLGVAALVGGVLGVVGLLQDEDSQVRTGPSPVATDPPRPAGPPADLVAITDDGAVVVVETVSGRRVRTLAPANSAAGATRPTRTPDGVWVYYATAHGCTSGSALYRVPADGSRAPERVATGTAPAVSPDGTKLAYAAVADDDDREPTAQCHSSVVIRTLASGSERRFLPTADTNSFVAYGEISLVDWAADSTRLVFQLGWEGEGSFLLDTARHTTTRDATPVGAKRIENGLVHATWHPPSGRVAAVDDCCYSSDAPRTPRLTYLVDPATGDATPLLEASVDPKSLDYDPTGEFLLYVDRNGALLVAGPGPSRRLGTGYASAHW